MAFEADTGIGPNYGETMALDAYIKQEQARVKSADELIFSELDNEAIIELKQDDEEEARERASERGTAETKKEAEG